MRVAIATVQVPYLTGGAEALAEGLRLEIAARGHPVEIISLPFRFFPPSEVERAMPVWEGEDFTHLNLYEPDRVICLKFPAYGLQHPAKTLWLCHQHRSAYDLFDARTASADELALRDRIREFDARHLAAFKSRYTISSRVSERLRQSISIDSTPLYHPPPMASRHYCANAQPYVFFPSRVEQSKRQELVIRAMPHVRSRCAAVFAGEGGQLSAAKRLAEDLGVSDRVRLLGRVSADDLLALYAHSAAVCFTPLDEDYGYVTLEAMLSAKPVITCTDSGGAVELLGDGESGFAVAPDPVEIAGAIDRLLGQGSAAARMGRAGRARYEKLIPAWSTVVDRLLT